MLPPKDALAGMGVDVACGGKISIGRSVHNGSGFIMD